MLYYSINTTHNKQQTYKINHKTKAMIEVAMNPQLSVVTLTV